jgi:hypothetical protein
MYSMYRIPPISGTKAIKHISIKNSYVHYTLSSDNGTMKTFFTILCVLLGLTVSAGNSLADSCYIQNQENTELGADKENTGKCSNNGELITLR